MSVKFTSKGLADGTDSTKELEFNVAGVTTGTTRTITVPDADVDLSVLGGPSLGTGAIIRTNGQTISENITIPADTNGMSIGDITIADTYTVTVNGRWVVI